MPVPNRDNVIYRPNSYVYFITPRGGTRTGQLGPVTVNTTMTFRDYYQVSSVRTPGFRKLRPLKLPWNAYSKTNYLLTDLTALYSQTALDGNGTFTEYYYSCNGSFLGLKVDPLAYASRIPDYPTQKVVSAIIEQCKQGRAQTGVALAEAHKTAAHLAHTAERIVKAITALKKCRFGDFTSALGITVSRRRNDRFYTNMRTSNGRTGMGFRYDSKSSVSREGQESRYRDFLSKTWLEYTYGWRPLLQDVYQHAEGLAQILIDSNGTLRIAFARTKIDSTQNWTEAHGQYDLKHQLKIERYLAMRVDYCIPNGIVNPANVFGLNNPASIAWELVPFSFVADWFIPIGTAIENLTAFQGLQFLRGIQMQRTHFRHQGNVIANGVASNQGGVIYQCTNASQKAVYDSIDMNRSIMSSFPSFGWPKYKDPRSISHATSAIALLQSLFLSGGTRQIKLR